MQKTFIQTGGTLSALATFCAQVRPRFWKAYGLALDPGVLRAVRAASPLTKIIARVTGGDQSWQQTPKEKARAWSGYALGQLSRVAGLFDIVEGVNEQNPFNEQEARWISDWHVEFAAQMHAAGIGAVCGYNFATDNPPLDLWQYLMPGLEACEYLGLHQYWLDPMDLFAVDGWQRHRKVFDLIGRKPTLITECGKDLTRFNKGGFLSIDQSHEDYAVEVARFDNEIAQYDNIHGATIFVGGADSAKWTTFEIGDFEKRKVWVDAFKGQLPAPAIPVADTWPEKPQPPAPPRPPTMILGVDVSAYQGDVDFETASLGFVIIKATEGVGFTDPKFGRNQAECRRLNIPRGYYHFARPDLGNSAIHEADWFLQTLGVLEAGEVLALDYEVGASDAVGWPLAFLARVQAAIGVRPLIYLNQATLARYDWSPVVRGDYGLWLAAYNDDPNQNDYTSGAWPLLAMRQWTSQARVKGIVNGVDADVFFGDVAMFKRYGLQSSPPPPPPPPPVEEIMPTSEEIRAAGFKSIGVDFNKEAWFQQVARDKALGVPLGQEDYNSIPGYIVQGFVKAILIAPSNNVMATERHSWDTGDLITVDPGPIIVPPKDGPLPYKFPSVLSAIGAVGVEGSPKSGQPFYRLTGAVVVRGVSAFCQVTVIRKDKSPAIGAQVLNLRPDGLGEIGVTVGSGMTQFNYARESAFTNPGEGPFTVLIAQGAKKDADTHVVSVGVRLSDEVHSLGDFQATHTEIYLQFVEQERPA